jgi:hypothetical protein
MVSHLVNSGAGDVGDIVFRRYPSWRKHAKRMLAYKTDSHEYQWAAKIVDKVLADLQSTLTDPRLLVGRSPRCARDMMAIEARIGRYRRRTTP